MRVGKQGDKGRAPTLKGFVFVRHQRSSGEADLERYMALVAAWRGACIYSTRRGKDKIKTPRARPAAKKDLGRGGEFRFKKKKQQRRGEESRWQTGHPHERPGILGRLELGEFCVSQSEKDEISKEKTHAGAEQVPCICGGEVLRKSSEGGAGQREVSRRVMWSRGDSPATRVGVRRGRRSGKATLCAVKMTHYYGFGKDRGAHGKAYS